MRKFISEAKGLGRPLKAEDYFGPYISGLVGILKEKGVELFNETLDGFSLLPEVIEDLTHQLEYEKRFGERAKTYEALRHDMVLWHFVRSKRPLQAESPLDARYWIVTVDFRLLGFDAFKRRKLPYKIPVCVHPVVLIQLFQFWIPRSPEFEEALLGSLRLPLLFQEFDPTAEKMTIRILEVLSRFENIGDLSEEAVHGILVNDALRQRLSTESDETAEVELVKEALIDEEKKARERLAAAENQIASQNATLEAAGAAIKRLESELSLIKEGETSRRGKLGFLRRWIFIPLVLTLLIGPVFAHLTSNWIMITFWKALLVAWGVLLIVWMQLVDRKGIIDPFVSRVSGFMIFHRWKNRIFWLLGTFLLGVAINAAWDGIKFYVTQSGSDVPLPPGK